MNVDINMVLDMSCIKHPPAPHVTDDGTMISSDLYPSPHMSINKLPMML